MPLTARGDHEDVRDLRWTRRESSPRRSRAPQPGALECPVMARALIPTVTPALFLDKVTVGKSSRDYPGRRVIFSQGDPADAVFYVDKGEVKLTVVSTGGK